MPSEQVSALFEQVDIIVTPTTDTQLIATNLSGNPALILPNGLRGDDAPKPPAIDDGDHDDIGGPGTPVSFTFLAGHYQEAKLVAFAPRIRRPRASTSCIPNWISGSVDQHPRQQRGSRRKVLDEHRFVPRMRAFAHRAHAVERGNAERRGEVAVGRAAGGGFVERKAQLAASACALRKSRTVPRLRSMGGRLMPPVTVSVQRGSAGLSAANLRSMRGPSARRGNAHVDLGPGLGGNHVALRAAAGHAHAHREPALEVGPAAHGFDHARQLADGARAFFEVDAGMRGDAFDLECCQSPMPLRAVL